MKYIVTTPGERTAEVEAKNSTQAKRKACKFFGIRPGDPWCGIPAMTAKQAKADEQSKEVSVNVAKSH